MTESDPVAVVADTVGEKKAVSPWFQFVGRVRVLTGLMQPEAMRLAGELRAEKAIDLWTDAEIAPRGMKWLRQNYMLMTPTLLAEKLAAVSRLAEKKKEVDEKAADVVEFVAEILKKKNPVLTAAATEFNLFYTTELPKCFADASAELLTSATQEDSYFTAMISMEAIAEKMKGVRDLEESLQKEEEKAAAKAAAKATAKAAKEAEKAAAKATAEAEKAAAKAAKATAAKKPAAEETEKGAPKKATAAAVGGAGIAPAPEPEVAALSIEDARRKGIPKHVKTLVWNKHIGAAVNSTKCMSCREELISIRNFHCGHVIAEAKGGDSTINNLRPICAACNSSMGTMSMNEFTKTFFGWEV